MLKRTAIGFVLATAIGSVSPANPMSIRDYDKEKREVQQVLIANKLQAILKQYTAKAHAKAICMNKLFTTTGSGGGSKLIDLVLFEIENARAKNPDKTQIEDVIYAVTERECAKAK